MEDDTLISVGIMEGRMYNSYLSKSKGYKICMTLLSVLSVGLLIAAYIWVSGRNAVLLPSVEQIWARCVKLFVSPIKGVNLLAHVWASLRRVLLALLFSWTAGVVFGILIGWNKTLNAIFGSIFELFRPIPPIAWIPIVIMWFGIGEFPKILIVIIGSIVPVVVNTRAGVSLVEQQYVDVGTVFGAGSRQMLVNIIMPVALPSIFAGLRTSVSSGWTVVLAAEMLGADHGVGALVTRGWNASDMALVLVSIIVIAIIGALLSVGLTLAEKVVCPWNQ